MTTSWCVASRANKKATDLGVLGLAATKAALDAKFGPPVVTASPMAMENNEDFNPSSWGKESEEEVTMKGLY